MADKIIIGELELDTTSIVKQQKDLADAIQNTKKRLKENAEQFGKNSEEYIKAEAELKGLQKQYNSNRNTLSKVTQAQKTNVGSLNQLRSQLSVVSSEWASLTEEERLNTDRGKQLTKAKKDLTEQLYNEEKATGDARRGVGRYADGILEAIDRLKKQETELRNNFRALNDASNALEEGDEKQEDFAIAIEQTKGELIKVNQELKSYGQNLDVTDAEIIDVSESTTKGADATEDYANKNKGLNNTIGKLRAGMGMLVGAVAGVTAGMKVAEKIINSTQTSGDQLAIITNQMEAAYAAFNKTIATGDLLNMITNLREAIQAGREYAEVMDDLGDRQRGLNVIEAESEVQLEKLKQQVDNVNLSQQQRLDAAEEIFNIENQLLKKRQSVRQQEFDAEVERLSALTGLEEDRLIDFIRNYDKESEIRSQAQEFIEQEDELAKSAVSTQRAISSAYAQGNTRLAKSYTERSNEIRERQKELKKTTSEDVQAYAELFRQYAKTTDDELDVIVEAYVALQNTESESLKQTKEITNKYNALIKSIREENEKRSESEQEVIQRSNERLQKITDNLQLELEFYRQYQKGRIDTAKAADEAIAESERQLRQNQQDAAALNAENEWQNTQDNLFARLSLERQYLEAERQQEIEFATKIGADVNAVNEKYDKAELELERTKFNAIASLAGGFAQNLAQIFGEQTAVGKAAAIAQTTIATIQSGVNSYNALSGIPIVGPALGAVAAAAAVANGIRQVKKITSITSGLPGEGGGGGASVPSPGGAAPTVPRPPQSQRTTSTGSVGAGVVSRSASDSSSNAVAEGVGKALNENPLQPTLVTDDVTNNQNSNQSANQTSTI